MRKADIVSAAVVVLFGLSLLFYFIPVWVPVVVENDYGLESRDLPNVAALLVTALAAMFLIKRLFAKRPDPSSAETPEAAAAAAAAAEDDETPPITLANAKYLLVASAVLIVLTALFKHVGFLVAGPLTIAGFMLLMRETRWLHIVFTSVVAAGAIWLFFWQLLSIPLP